MATSLTLLSNKRKHSEVPPPPSTPSTPEVVEILSDDEETPSAPPPAKRQKSHTPVENGWHSDNQFSGSRDASEHRRPPLQAQSPDSRTSSKQPQPPVPSTPSTSRVLPDGVNTKSSQGKRSPWGKLSKYSIVNSAIDLTWDLGSTSLQPSGAPRERAIAVPPQSEKPKDTSPLSVSLKDLRGSHRSSSSFASSSLNPEPTIPNLLRDDVRSRSSTPSRSPAPPHSHLPVRSATNKKNPFRDERKNDLAPRPSQISIDIPRRPTPEAQSIKRPVQDSSQNTQIRNDPSAPLRQRSLHTPSRVNGSSQSNIEVIIPSSPHHELLAQFRGRPPKSKAVIQAEKKVLLEELKKDTTTAHENPQELQRLFGQTGFSTRFSVDEDHERMKKAASNKRKKSTVIRLDTRLEIEETLTVSLENLSLSKKMIHPSKSARDILTSRFNEKFTPPLTFTNNVNEGRLHGKFQFIDRYVFVGSVRAAAPSKNRGCDCTTCHLSTCNCFKQSIENKNGKVTHTEQIQTYIRRSDGVIVLSDEFIARSLSLDLTLPVYPITECNEFCRCGDDCLNRVVSKGRTVPLEIFQTKKCGFGVRSSQDIVKGQFIDTYLGEVMTAAELERREDAADEGDDSYTFSLDWFDESNCYHVDGAYFGTAMRFVNHSCNPNAHSFMVQLHKEDKKIFYLAFFAIRDIKAGEEIRIHYQGTSVSECQDDMSRDDADLEQCCCGEPNCRKLLWTPKVKARRRRRRRAD